MMTAYQIALILLLSYQLLGQTSEGLSTQYKASLATALAAHEADVLTTYYATRDGQAVEGNPLVLGTADGRFTAKTVAIHSAIGVGLAVGQYILVRKHPKLARIFTYLNFGSATVHSYSAVHNVRLQHSLQSNQRPSHR